VPKLGIKEPIQPGMPAEISLDTSRKGEFKVECSGVCGSGGGEMQAKIAVG